MSSAWQIRFNGIVQGVGFRPFVYKLATELGIKGWVNNSSHGVYIHAEGEQLEIFYRRLIEEAPPLSKIVSAEKVETSFQGYTSFKIVESLQEDNPDVLISPDVATCQDCLSDIYDPGNRRYRYPFTNCTNCGPRYTIIRDVPYDRVQTTMAKFPMCPECAEEYHNPLDRRFHAQPVACKACGPEVQLLNTHGKEVPGLGIDELAQGAILAVKGLGGFHLVCDARNSKVVRRLRERKERGAKPFALMVRNLDKAREEVVVSQAEEELLMSPAAPIVILERLQGKEDPLPEEIAPGLHTLGLMLPYTPLHHLLFDGPYDFLVMTSANLSGRPLIYQNEVALKELKDIADFFLVHNREIFHPCDDSVVQVIGEIPVFHRRARGYVPLPVDCPQRIETPLLGVGGELKNAFCLASGQRAFVSQYMGDMEGYENFQRFKQELKSFQKVARVYPQVIAHDAHPNYQTTRFALDSPLPKVSVQHHHAHLVSVLGEHGRQEQTLGIICDGTGFGTDGHIWGFEFLWGNAQGFERKAHLEYLPLPGGDAGARHPLRIAYAYAKTLLGPKEFEQADELWEALSKEERKVLDVQLARGLNVFQTSSAGRFFDAVSALLGICTLVTYEGQAAIELESQATRWAYTHGVKLSGTDKDTDEKTRDKWKSFELYPVDITDEHDRLVLRIGPFCRALVQDILAQKDKGEIAYKFHLSFAKLMVDTAIRLNVKEGPLVLNGGVFQNKLLTEQVLELCQKHGIKVLRARSLPPGDGGLSFGQILIANEVVERCV